MKGRFNVLIALFFLLVIVFAVLIFPLTHSHPECTLDQVTYMNDAAICNAQGGYSSQGAYGDAHTQKTGNGCGSIEKSSWQDDNACVCYGLANATYRAICVGSSAASIDGGMKRCAADFPDQTERDICYYNVLIKAGNMAGKSDKLLAICQGIENKALNSDCVYHVASITGNGTVCIDARSPDCAHTCSTALVFYDRDARMYNPEYLNDTTIASCLSDLPAKYRFYLDFSLYAKYQDPEQRNYRRFLYSLNVTDIDSLDIRNGAMIATRSSAGQPIVILVKCISSIEGKPGGGINDIVFQGQDGADYEIGDDGDGIRVYTSPHRPINSCP